LVPPPWTGGQELSHSESVVQAPQVPPLLPLLLPELELPASSSTPPLDDPLLLLELLLPLELEEPDELPPSWPVKLPPDELVVPPSSVRPKPPPVESPCPHAVKSAPARRAAETEKSDETETLMNVLPVLPTGGPHGSPPGVFAFCSACRPAPIACETRMRRSG
jgi:hypothetical protein